MSKKETLDKTHPNLVKEWHPTKNGNLFPISLTHGSNKKVWWKCDKGDDHEWEASISNRARLGRGCSVCAGKKVVDSNCLATTHPHLVKEWHSNRNGTSKPKHFVAGSGRKVWWKCDKGDDHEWEAKIANRAILNRSCPICSGHKIVYSNSLQNVYPELAEELHPHKNGKLTANKIYAGGNKQYWWKCDKGDDHEWESDIPHRVRANKPGGCPICINRKIVTSNRLTITNPEIVKEWHPIKNGKLNPSNYTAGSLKKVWWKCDKGDDHEWNTTISKRVQRNQDCPVCLNKKIVLSNCLKTTHLHLIDEWDFERNTLVLPTKVGAGSHKRVWWKCKINNRHIWRAIIYTRALNAYGCPFCTLTPQSREELVILFELKSIFKNINPKGYKIKIDNKLKAIDIYIPELALAVEYDGSYWHKNKKEVDKQKSKILIDQGMKVIRLRQKPLKKIFKNDILVNNKFNGKKITDDILTQIKNNYDLNKIQLRKINKYLNSDDLHNEKSMETFIDMILRGK